MVTHDELDHRSMAVSGVTGRPDGGRAWLLLTHDPDALSHVSWSYVHTCGSAYATQVNTHVLLLH